jgi:hypothetical protein
MMITNTAIEVQNDVEYDAFIQRINARFNALTGPIFETDAADLYAVYLDGFADPVERQYHTCSCCRQFIERFGGLVVVGDDGLLVSAMWNEDEAPEQYKKAVAAMARQVRRAKIMKPFLSVETLYGSPISGDRVDGGQWHHFAVKPEAARVYRNSPLKNAFQAASEKREDFATVRLALMEYPPEIVATALQLLKNDQLGNSEAVVAQARFLADLHAARAESMNMDNTTWRMVAVAPSGFCHPRSGIIATLLDDIATGKPYEQVKAAWNAKMHPLQYQRPQAAPTAGAIKAAEEAFEKMGAASALKRRYATITDILDKVWEPKRATPAQQPGGIFASIKPKGETSLPMSMRAPALVMTWEKFARTVLPSADQVEFYATHGHAPYVALTTAADPNAVPLLQWDRAERRNPVALYLWNGGSAASQFGLTAGQYHKVNAVTLRPSEWFGGGFEHQGGGAILIIDGCKDGRKGAGSALFPQTIKSEFHGVRSVIEAYSKANELEGRDEASACGMLISKGEASGVQLRVTSAGQTTEYKIDRWD